MMSNDIFPNKFKAALAAQRIQIGCWSALANPHQYGSVRAGRF
ncbi:alpha-dehydro-beta-deoxy-D-glucarate aldolase [Citrobacter koseri]|nr:alpha-dehydro-beta-deoxy-D-glucarate aldolase [Citrobacter koseri]